MKDSKDKKIYGMGAGRVVALGSTAVVAMYYVPGVFVCKRYLIWVDILQWDK